MSTKFFRDLTDAAPFGMQFAEAKNPRFIELIETRLAVLKNQRQSEPANPLTSNGPLFSAKKLKSNEKPFGLQFTEKMPSTIDKEINLDELTESQLEQIMKDMKGPKPINLMTHHEGPTPTSSGGRPDVQADVSIDWD